MRDFSTKRLNRLGRVEKVVSEFQDDGERAVRLYWLRKGEKKKAKRKAAAWTKYCESTAEELRRLLSSAN